MLASTASASGVAGGASTARTAQMLTPAEGLVWVHDVPSRLHWNKAGALLERLDGLVRANGIVSQAPRGPLPARMGRPFLPDTRDDLP